MGARTACRAPLPLRPGACGPPAAGLRDAHSRESLRGAAAISSGTLLLVVVAFVAVFVAVAVYALVHFHP